jgi:hypothetical protein
LNNKGFLKQRFPWCKDLVIMEPVSKVIGFFTKWGHEVEKTMIGVLNFELLKSPINVGCVQFYPVTNTMQLQGRRGQSA